MGAHQARAPRVEDAEQISESSDVTARGGDDELDLSV